MRISPKKNAAQWQRFLTNPMLIPQTDGSALWFVPDLVR